jgi:hypothetical protein
MVSKKLIEIDKGAYKLIVEVEYSDELPDISEGVAQTIADAVEKAKNENKKKKKSD